MNSLVFGVPREAIILGRWSTVSTTLVQSDLSVIFQTYRRRVTLPKFDCYNSGGATFVGRLIIGAPSTYSIPYVSTPEFDLRVLTYLVCF